MLISTYDIRLWMGTPEGDKDVNPKLSYISQAVQDFVESYTNRQLEAKRYLTDPDYSYFDGNGRDFIYLPVYPVSYVSSVHIDANREFGSGTLVASADLFWYPRDGKLVLDSDVLYRGRRTIRIDYIAGYAPIAGVVGGTHNPTVSSYPIPNDLKQTMIEMCVESIKEGITAVHTVQPGAGGGDPRVIQMLSRNSSWTNVLNKYKSFDSSLGDYDE